MLATFLHLPWARPLAVPIGPGLLECNGRQQLQIQVDGLRTRWLGLGWLRPPRFCLLLPPLSPVPLPVMARTLESMDVIPNS